MNISIFEVTGPVMIGPSSSHTAGAARLARIARQIVSGPFSHVSFGLHGSFAKTYAGHGTDRALVAGALGLASDDEGIVNAFALAEKAGLTWDFYETELEDIHENSVKMTFHMENGARHEITGSSVGGGEIRIRRINDFETDLSMQSSTLLVQHLDKRGVVSKISWILAQNDINIGVMKLTRRSRGEKAFCVIETDSEIPVHAVEELREAEHILHIQAINIVQGGA